MIINKKYYETYFTNLVKFLNLINYPFLYHLPLLFKRDFRNNLVLKINFFSLINFNNDILINKKKNFLETEVCFVSHYVGIVNKKNPTLCSIIL